MRLPQLLGRRQLNDQLVPLTQVSEGAVLTQDALDSFMLVSALGVSETRGDGRVVYEVPEERSGYGLPAGLLQGFLHGLPRLPEPLALPDQSAQDTSAPEPVQERQSDHNLPQQPRHLHQCLLDRLEMILHIHMYDLGVATCATLFLYNAHSGDPTCPECEASQHATEKVCQFLRTPHVAGLCHWGHFDL